MVVSSKFWNGRAVALKRGGRKVSRAPQTRKPAARLDWKEVAEFAEVGAVKPAFSLILVGLSALCFCACKPGPGSSCDPREARCLDAHRAIVCDDGRFREVPCRGKAGCSTVGETTSCDFSGNQAGDACGRGNEGVAACAGDDAMLSCHGRKLERVPCRGPRGCEMFGAQANCDQSVAELGEVCKKQNAKACSADKSQVLFCNDGRMSVQYHCRGVGQCSSAGGKLACDQTVAKLGDVCDKSLGGHVACSEDKKSLVTCRNERFVPFEKCKLGTLCAVSGQSTKCEKP